MDLPERQSGFDFEFTAELGKKYDGKFTVWARLNIAQKHMLELEKTRLLGNGSNPTDHLTGIAIVLANLRSKVIDGPNWWMQSNGGYSIDDEDVLVELYNKVQEAELEWKKKMIEKAQATTSTEKTSP